MGQGGVGWTVQGGVGWTVQGGVGWGVVEWGGAWWSGVGRGGVWVGQVEWGGQCRVEWGGQCKVEWGGAWWSGVGRGGVWVGQVEWGGQCGVRWPVCAEADLVQGLQCSVALFKSLGHLHLNLSKLNVLYLHNTTSHHITSHHMGLQGELTESPPTHLTTSLTHQLFQVVQLSISLVQERLKIAFLLQQQLSLPIGVGWGRVGRGSNQEVGWGGMGWGRVGSAVYISVVLDVDSLSLPFLQ